MFALAEGVNAVLVASLRRACVRQTRRWVARWRDVELLVNPNGPLSDAGSRKDNGQTGRKLVMDYYGPRVPIGGGAIYGKHPTHVDRFGARVARELAVDAVKRGAGECLVRAVYAPNVAEPLDVQVEVMQGDALIHTGKLVLCTPVDSRSNTARIGLEPASRAASVAMFRGRTCAGRGNGRKFVERTMLRMKYKVALHRSDEGFAVSVPGLPGCWSQGRPRPRRSTSSGTRWNTSSH